MSELNDPNVKFGRPSTSTVPRRVTGGSCVGPGEGGAGCEVSQVGCHDMVCGGA